MKLLGFICLVLFLVESSIQMNIRNDEFRNIVIVNINPESNIKLQQILEPRNQVNLESTIVKNGEPKKLNIKVNPQDIQFTVPDVPESTRLQIIEQIRAQLGSSPLTLEELNNKFVTFTATVPGEEINRTIVTTQVDNQTDISKTTRTTQVRVSQGAASNYESHSTQYPPILSHSFNPVAPVAIPTS